MNEAWNGGGTVTTVDPPPTEPGPPSYAHLSSLTDHRGVFEHAVHDAPRRGHGYCVDDVARALIVVVREPDQTEQLSGLTETYVRFLEDALVRDGTMHNRMSAFGEWTDEGSLGDWWGRAVWAFGVAAAHAPLEPTRKRALDAFHIAGTSRSPFLRSMVFATIGAAEVLSAYPHDTTARQLVRAGIAAVPAVPVATAPAPADPDAAAAADPAEWIWPEPRLNYGNAAIPEALIAAGRALGDRGTIARGTRLLDFLLEIETTGEHLSVSGSAGRDPGQASPLFDQQSIELAAIADACARAHEVTDDPRWLSGVRLAWSWFTGSNDSGVLMWDAETGAGYDGLEPEGRNENRGAESTLAALSTYQQARRLGLLNASGHLR